MAHTDLPKYIKPSDKFRLIIICQDQENYAWDDDGNLGVSEKAYWKMKGGSTWCAKELTLADAQRGHEYLLKIVREAQPAIEQDGEGFRSHMVDWALLNPGELTEYEKSIMEYEGNLDGLGGSACPCSVDWWKEVRKHSQVVS